MEKGEFSLNWNLVGTTPEGTLGPDRQTPVPAGVFQGDVQELFAGTRGQDHPPGSLVLRSTGLRNRNA